MSDEANSVRYFQLYGPQCWSRVARERSENATTAIMLRFWVLGISS